MGIQSLIKHVEGLSDCDSHIKNWASKCVAVDISSWVFKGAFSCAEELFNGGPYCTTKYIDYVVNRAGMFRFYGVEPIFVFDGRRTQLKAAESQRRKRAQEENQRKAREFLSMSEQASSLEKKEQYKSIARDYMRKCVRVTWALSARVLAALRQRGYRALVAPYEADAQVAYLCRLGWAAAAATEDSDVAVYSATCPAPFPVLLKLEGDGRCREFTLAPAQVRARLAAHAAAAAGSASASKKGSFVDSMGKILRDEGWPRMFVQVACLSGCDYIDSLPGVGLSTAAKMVEEMRRVPAGGRLARVLYHYARRRRRRAGGDAGVPDNFLESLKRIEFNFLFYQVYDPEQSKCVYFNKPEDFPDLLDCWKDKHYVESVLGEQIPTKMAQYICNGMLDPNTKELPNINQLGPLPENYWVKPEVGQGTHSRPVQQHQQQQQGSAFVEGFTPASHSSQAVRAGSKTRPAVSKPRAGGPFQVTTVSLAYARKRGGSMPLVASPSGPKGVFRQGSLGMTSTPSSSTALKKEQELGPRTEGQSSLTFSCSSSKESRKDGPSETTPANCPPQHQVFDLTEEEDSPAGVGDIEDIEAKQGMWDLDEDIALMSNDAELEALQKEILSIKFDARNVSKQRRQKDGKSQKSQEGNPFLNTKNYKAPSIFEAFGITPLAKPNKPAQPPTVGSSGAQASNPNGVDFRTIASGEDDDVEQQIAVDNSFSAKGPSSEAPGSSANKDAADVSYLEQKELLEMLATSTCEKTASVVPLSLSAQLGGRKRESREEVCNNGDEVTPAVEMPPPHSMNPFKKSKQTNNIAATLPKSIKNGGSTIIRNKDFVAAAGTPSLAVPSASPARTLKDDSMIMKNGKRRLSQNQLPTTSKGKRVQKKTRPPGGSINGKKGGAGMATLHQFFNASKS